MEQALPVQGDWLNFNRFALRAEKTVPLGPLRCVGAAAPSVCSSLFSLCISVGAAAPSVCSPAFPLYSLRFALRAEDRRRPWGGHLGGRCGCLGAAQVH